VCVIIIGLVDGAHLHAISAYKDLLFLELKTPEDVSTHIRKHLSVVLAVEYLFASSGATGAYWCCIENVCICLRLCVCVCRLGCASYLLQIYVCLSV
jgi:hypothetical protein